MTDERQNESHLERDSQLSAMFDGELPGAECELLARRLTRDEALRAQWSRFSMIGAALRNERGVALHDRIAWRVSSMVAQEVTYGDGTVDSAAATSTNTAVAGPASARVSASARWARFTRPVAGIGIAAGVAAMSIMWLRADVGPDPMLASNAAPETSVVLTPEATGSTVALNDTAPVTRAPSNGEPDFYVTPAPSSSASIAPPARLANYVVAHSEYSGPLSRRMALLGLVATDPDAVPADSDADADADAGAPDAP